MKSICLKNVEIFPTLIHELHEFFEDEYVDNLRKICENIECAPKSNFGLQQSIDSYLHKNEDFKTLVFYIKSVLNTIKIAEEYDTDEFVITQMWLNKSYKGAFHEQHWHSNSFFSGIFYLTEGSPTVFYDPVVGRQMSSMNVWASTTQPAIALPPKPGLLRVFPSYLQHKTLPSDIDGTRMTLSFNCVPSGKINTRNPYTRLSELEIEIK